MIEGSFQTTIACEECKVRMDCIRWTNNLGSIYELYCAKCQQTLTLDHPPLGITTIEETQIKLEKEG